MEVQGLGEKARAKLLRRVQVRAAMEQLWHTLPLRRDRIDLVVAEALLRAIGHAPELRPQRASQHPLDAVAAAAAVDGLVAFETFARILLARVEQSVTGALTEASLLQLLQLCAAVVKEMLPIEVDHVWGTDGEAGEAWEPFPPEVSAAIERRFSAGAECCVLDLGEESFFFDFDAMEVALEASPENANQRLPLLCRASLNRERSFLNRRSAVERQRQDASAAAARRAEAHRGKISERHPPAGHISVWLLREGGEWHAVDPRFGLALEIEWRHAGGGTRTPPRSFAVAVGSGTADGERRFTVNCADQLLGAVITDDSVPGAVTSISRRIIADTTSLLAIPQLRTGAVALHTVHARLQLPATRMLLAHAATMKPLVVELLAEYLAKGVVIIAADALTEHSDSLVELLDELVMRCAVPLSAIRISQSCGSRASGSKNKHELLLRRHWVPLGDVNDWLLTRKHSALIVGARWCPLNAGELAAFVDGEWCWIREAARPGAFVRMLCGADEPLSVHRPLLEKTAFPIKFCDPSVVVRVAGKDATKLRRALDIYAALEQASPNSNVGALESQAMHLSHQFTFLGINIAAALTAARVKLAQPTSDVRVSQTPDWLVAETRLVDDAASPGNGDDEATSDSTASHHSRAASVASAAQFDADDPPRQPSELPLARTPPLSPKVEQCTSENCIVDFGCTPHPAPSPALTAQHNHAPRWQHVLTTIHSGIFDALIAAPRAAVAGRTPPPSNVLKTNYSPPRLRSPATFEYNVCSNFTM